MEELLKQLLEGQKEIFSKMDDVQMEIQDIKMTQARQEITFNDMQTEIQDIKMTQARQEITLNKLERALPASEKRVIGEINLQMKYVLDDIERAEARILKQIKKEALAGV